MVEKLRSSVPAKEVPSVGLPVVPEEPSGLPPEIQTRIDELFSNNSGPSSFKGLARVLGYAKANGSFNNRVREVAQALGIDIKEGEKANLTLGQARQICEVLGPNPGRKSRPQGKGVNSNTVNGDLPQETNTVGSVPSASLVIEEDSTEEEEEPEEYEDGEYEKGEFTFTRNEMLMLARAIVEDRQYALRGNEVRLETNDLYEINLIIVRMENKTGRKNISVFDINNIISQLREKLSSFPKNRKAFSQQNGDDTNTLLTFISKIEKNATSFSYAIEKLLPVLTPRELDLAANSPPPLATEPWRMRNLRAD